MNDGENKGGEEVVGVAGVAGLEVTARFEEKGGEIEDFGGRW